jgi:hypothetical protein
MLTETVIAAYRPKKGKAKALDVIVQKHVPTLRALGLATKRPTVCLRAKSDGTILEIFEWESKEAVDAAHRHPKVKELWDAFSKVCDYTPLSSLSEASEPFAHFERVPGLES